MKRQDLLCSTSIYPFINKQPEQSADYPLAPHGQSVRRESVNANVAGVAVAAQYRAAEIFRIPLNGLI
jgi:hypothetical protein